MNSSTNDLGGFLNKSDMLVIRSSMTTQLLSVPSACTLVSLRSNPSPRLWAKQVLRRRSTRRWYRSRTRMHPNALRLASCISVWLSFHSHHPGQGFDAKNNSGSLLSETGMPNMSRLQIAIQRNVYGWPLYTTIITIGQMLGATSFQDYPAFRPELADKPSVLRARPCLLGCFDRMVHALPSQALGLCSRRALDLLRPRIFLIGIPTLSNSPTPYRQAFGSAANWAYALHPPRVSCCSVRTSVKKLVLRLKYGRSVRVSYKARNKSG
jgi:hypothetical protein